jgi:hypothetical protein
MAKYVKEREVFGREESERECRTTTGEVLSESGLREEPV